MPPEGPITLDFNTQPGDQGQRTGGHAAVGRRYSVQLHIADAPSIRSWNAVLLYDPAALAFVEGSFKTGDFIAGQVGLANAEDGRLELGGTVLGGDAVGQRAGWLGGVDFEVLVGFVQHSEVVLSKVGWRLADGGQEVQRVRLVATITSEAVDPVLSGDFSRDGIVDLNDFFLFVDAFGSDDPHFDLDSDGEVSLGDFFLFVDTTLVDGLRQAGTYTVAWDGRDGHGQALASGVYLYRLQAGTQVETRKLVLVR